MDQHHYNPVKDIINKIQEYFPSVSYETVYRNLYLLTDEELLETTELNREKHFRLAAGPDHQHYFICKICRAAKVIELCPMELVKNTLKGYYVENHKFEVYGICPQCP